MQYYDSFLFNIKNPHEEFYSFEQEMVNEDFNCAPTWFQDIEQEVEFGSLEFTPIDARINQIMDSKVGDKINDDYRKIIFRDLNFKPELGSRYRFDNNIWIVYSTDNIKNVHSSCYIRRCNNTINIQDEYGKVHEEPCVIDVKPTKSGITEQEHMSTPVARQVLMYQINRWTLPLFINSRIMFNRQVYKIGSIMELDRTETFNKNSIKLAKCYIDNDLVNDYDNLELQVADYRHYDYTVDVIKDLIGIVNKTGTLSGEIRFENKVVDEQIHWYSSDESIISIEKLTGNYKMLKTGQAIIYAKMANNEEFCSQIQVVISGEEVQIYNNIISPSIDYIPLKRSQEFEVYETLNGQKINTLFDIQVMGMKAKYYDLKIVGNKFIITNNIPNDNELLQIQCKNLRNQTTIILEVELGGLF